MLSIEQLRVVLADYQISAIARDTGLSHAGIINVLRRGASPRYSTLEKLSAFAEQQKAKLESLK